MLYSRFSLVEESFLNKILKKQLNIREKKKKKVSKLNCVKIMNFCSYEDTIKRMKK